MIILACMFSDTHFHFKMMADERGLDGAAVLSEMAKKDCFFGLDIGTKADDLKGRQDCVEKAILNIAENGQPELSQKARRFIYFSAGIWPDVDSIKDRFAQVKKLEENILQAQNGFEQTKDLNQKVIEFRNGNSNATANFSSIINEDNYYFVENGFELNGVNTYDLKDYTTPKDAKLRAHPLVVGEEFVTTKVGSSMTVGTEYNVKADGTIDTVSTVSKPVTLL